MVLQICPEEDWKRLGEVDPYYGVLAHEKFKSTNIDEKAKQEFFASGIKHVDQVLAVLKSAYGFVPDGTAVDFGCGVGRITSALSRHFQSVVGLDISPGMLAEAEINSILNRTTNVDYKSSVSQSSLAPNTYDLVHTYIVLQHVPVNSGEGIIRNLVKATKIGGCGAIHVTISENCATAVDRAIRRVKRAVKNVPLLRNVGNLALGRSWNYPAMQMNAYSLPRIIQIFAECGVENFTVVRVDDWGHIGVFLFYKKISPADASSPWSNPVQPRAEPNAKQPFSQMSASNVLLS
jgi:2-polyprenyl-3-methyl-5-hydroxy-6-metoxy-1,4-benzoquinol methylase